MKLSVMLTGGKLSRYGIGLSDFLGALGVKLRASIERLRIKVGGRFVFRLVSWVIAEG
jgi:hypothetical protein